MANAQVHLPSTGLCSRGPMWKHDSRMSRPSPWWTPWLPTSRAFLRIVTVSVYDDVEVVMAEASDNCSAATVLYADEVDGSANDFALITAPLLQWTLVATAATATQTITVLEVLGCMDASACNYSDVATADDGSCDYCSCDGVYPATDLTAWTSTPSRTASMA